MNEQDEIRGVLARATAAHYIRLGERQGRIRVGEEQALGQGHIPFTVWKLTDEEVRSASLPEIERHLVERDCSTSDKNLVSAVLSATHATVFWTVSADNIVHWCSADNGPIELGAQYRFRRSSRGWRTVRRPNGSRARRSDLPQVLAGRAKYNGTLCDGSLEAFRAFVTEGMVHDPEPKEPLGAVRAAVSLDDQAMWQESFDTMLRHAKSAVRQSGTEQLSVRKQKRSNFGSDEEAHELMWAMIRRQNGKCALSGLALVPHSIAGDAEGALRPSLDRRSSDGHYHADNLHVVCQFINFWKRATPESDFVRLLEMVSSQPAGGQRALPRLE